MKLKKISVGLCLTFGLISIVDATSALAWRGPRYGRPVYVVPVYGRAHYGVRCSPELEKKSMDAAQSIFEKSAKSEKFADAKVFQQFVEDTSKIQDTNDRMHAYLTAIDVDTKDAKALMDLVTTRDAAPYAAAAEKHLDLSKAQSALLVKELKQAYLSLINQ